MIGRERGREQIEGSKIDRVRWIGADREERKEERGGKVALMLAVSIKQADKFQVQVIRHTA